MLHREKTGFLDSQYPSDKKTSSRSIEMTRHVLCSIAIMALFSVRIPSVFGESNINLMSTGQIKCYDTWGTVVDCLNTGQDGEYQAGEPWPNPRFTITNCNDSGPCANPAANCDGNVTNDVVTDNLSGLMWARNGNQPTGKLNWEGAINYSNNLALCGYDDWRLPNIVELQSLIHEGESNSAGWLNTNWFLNVVGNSSYWTSTTYAAGYTNGGSAWANRTACRPAAQDI
jgi:hypothetical protein